MLEGLPEPRDKFYLPFLQKIAMEIHPKRYLEVGVMSGRSICAVLKAWKYIEQIVMVDDFRASYSKPYGWGYVNKKLDEMGYNQEREWFNKNSHEALSIMIKVNENALPLQNYMFDMIFVDGDHTAEGARQDLDHCWQLLNRGGALVFHDINHTHHRYLEEVFDKFVGSYSNTGPIIEKTHAGSGTAVVRKK